ncbi:hypothetical protein [Dyella lutea]|uniref:Transposase of IS4/5 family DUF4096 n=1 Tax=Dyella lutea TaxID=2950441 RepID=A0ABT1F779_9GAMM|nr:hypothetical protein [Dyella lutea]MCP1373223.1 hypothetical protein [Dyella lutea]
MKEFIPLEDDWTLIEAFLGQRLVPYQPGMPCAHEAGVRPPRGDRVKGCPERKFVAPPSQPLGAAL